MSALQIGPLIPVAHAKTQARTNTRRHWEAVCVPVAATGGLPNVWGRRQKKKKIYILLLSMRWETFPKPSEAFERASTSKH